VAVKSDDAYGNPSDLSSSTLITLTVAPGAGTLTGTDSSSIGTGADSVIISGAIYSSGGTNTFTASASGGQSLTAATTAIVFQPGGPPVASAATYAHAFSTDIQISVTNLLTNFTADAYGDPVDLVSVAGGLLTNYSQIATTTNGSSVFYAYPYLNSSYLILGPTNNNLTSYVNGEVIQYVVQDTYFPTFMATNTITINVTNAVGQTTGSISTVGGSVLLSWAGIPGTTNVTQRAIALAGPWTNIFTNVVPGPGLFTNFDTSPPQPSAFYQLQQYSP
jgi:hypothetical protein